MNRGAPSVLSIAEARFQQGRYPEAITAFREDIAKFPEEVYPHTRIAEIQLEKLGDADAAIAEMYFALGKTQGAEAFALVADTDNVIVPPGMGENGPSIIVIVRRRRL